MKYSVEIIETLSRKIALEATDPDEAHSMVAQSYRDGDVVLSADDFVDVDFKVTGSQGDNRDNINEAELKFVLTALRKSDKNRLHLIDRGIDSDNSKFVVCGNYDTESDTWDWGTYCDNLKNSLTIFTQKCDEHGFDVIVEGYIEKQN